MVSDETFRVWVGCLACYNEGRSVGEWFDADDAPTEMDDFLTHVKHRASFPPHEELWCFETENSPVSGEMSPMDARYYAEMLEDLTIPAGALAAWIDNQNGDIDEAVEQATEAYIGDMEESIWFYYADAFDESELPEWAQPYYNMFIDKIVKEARIAGEWYEHKGYYFRGI